MEEVELSLYCCHRILAETMAVRLLIETAEVGDEVVSEQERPLLCLKLTEDLVDDGRGDVADETFGRPVRVGDLDELTTGDEAHHDEEGFHVQPPLTGCTGEGNAKEPTLVHQKDVKLLHSLGRRPLANCGSRRGEGGSEGRIGDGREGWSRSRVRGCKQRWELDGVVKELQEGDDHVTEKTDDANP
jgi:hypothetical protein